MYASSYGIPEEEERRLDGAGEMVALASTPDWAPACYSGSGPHLPRRRPSRPHFNGPR